MDTAHYMYGRRWKKKGMSAVCQRFGWVDGRADTALGIRGQTSAYPSIPLSLSLPLFPSIHLSLPSIYPLSNWVSLAKGREREGWHRKGEAGHYWAVFKLCHQLNTALSPEPVTLTCYIQNYRSSEANSFIFAADWKHLGLTSTDEYESQYFSFYFQVFTSRSVKQLGR